MLDKPIVHVHKYYTILPGKGRFHIVRFSDKLYDLRFPSRDWQFKSTNQVFCFSMMPNDELNPDWSKAKKCDFKIKQQSDLDIIRLWMRAERQIGKIVSELFIKE